jgi:hypothetical protein
MRRHLRQLRPVALTVSAVLTLAAVTGGYAQQAGLTVTHRSSASIPADGYATFQTPRRDALSPLHLIVLSRSGSSQPAMEATYDAQTLTSTAPSRYTPLPPVDCQAAPETTSCQVNRTVGSVRIVARSTHVDGEQPPGPRCRVVSYFLEPGWNVVAGSRNLHGIDGPFYALESGQYISVAPDELELGRGYLTYLGSAATVTAEYLDPAGQACSFPVQSQGEPPVPCQWRLVGNAIAGRVDVQPPAGPRAPEYAPPWLHNEGTPYSLGVGQGYFAWTPC